MADDVLFGNVMPAALAALESGTLVVNKNDDDVFVVHAPDRDPTEDFYDVVCLAE